MWKSRNTVLLFRLEKIEKIQFLVKKEHDSYLADEDTYRYNDSFNCGPSVSYTNETKFRVSFSLLSD